jgi:MATE family multidrug resistance protein
MVIYGVSLWGVGLAGGYWIAFHHTPLGEPYGAFGFWLAGAFGLALAAVALSWLAASVSYRHAIEEPSLRAGG